MKIVIQNGWILSVLLLTVSYMPLLFSKQGRKRQLFYHRKQSAYNKRFIPYLPKPYLRFYCSVMRWYKCALCNV